MQYIRHSETVEDEVGLTELQRQNFHHFVEETSAISEDENFDLSEDSDLDDDLIRDVMLKFKYPQKMFQQCV